MIIQGFLSLLRRTRIMSATYSIIQDHYCKKWKMVNRMLYSIKPNATVFASPNRSIIGFATDKEIMALIPLQLKAMPVKSKI